MRKKRAHDKNLVMCSSIVNTMITDVFRVGEAREKCREINHELARDSCANSLISDAINQVKIEIADNVAHAKEVVSKMENRKRKQAEHMRKWRASKRAEDEEGYLNIQREYRARKKEEEQEAIDIVSNSIITS